ncbi:hypothetical protein LINGRAHAP2_LOCUS4918, partial [Linum grandiflorum]
MVSMEPADICMHILYSRYIKSFACRRVLSVICGNQTESSDRLFFRLMLLLPHDSLDKIPNSVGNLIQHLPPLYRTNKTAKLLPTFHRRSSFLRPQRARAELGVWFSRLQPNLSPGQNH